MHARLTTRDATEICLLRKMNIIQAVDPCLLHQLKPGDIFVPCADADRIRDMIDQHCRYQAEHRVGARAHLLSLNGGALRIVNDPEFGGAAIMQDIADTLRLVKTDMHHVSLCGHTPCGKYPLAPNETVRTLATAKISLRSYLEAQGLENIAIQCFYHVDHGNACAEAERFRTYRVNIDATIHMPQFVHHGQKALIDV